MKLTIIIITTIAQVLYYDEPTPLTALQPHTSTQLKLLIG